MGSRWSVSPRVWVNRLLILLVINDWCQSRLCGPFLSGEVLVDLHTTVFEHSRIRHAFALRRKL